MYPWSCTSPFFMWAMSQMTKCDMKRIQPTENYHLTVRLSSTLQSILANCFGSFSTLSLTLFFDAAGSCLQWGSSDKSTAPHYPETLVRVESQGCSIPITVSGLLYQWVLKYMQQPISCDLSLHNCMHLARLFTAQVTYIQKWQVTCLT